MPELDRIHIHDLKTRCIIGINPEERLKKQDVIINITLEADLRPAGLSDDIADTVDYATIKQRVFDMVEASDFFLVERLAQCIADICLSDERVIAARVRVAKPGALRFARSVDVDISRQRNDAS